MKEKEIGEFLEKFPEWKDRKEDIFVYDYPKLFFFGPTQEQIRKYHKTYLLGKLQVFVEGEVGRKLTNYSDIDKVLRVTIKDVEQYTAKKKECIDKLIDKMIPKRRKEVIEGIEQIELVDNRNWIPILSQRELLEAEPTYFEGPIVENIDDANLETMKVKSIFAQYNDLDLRPYTGPVWSGVIQDIKKEFSINSGPLNYGIIPSESKFEQTDKTPIVFQMEMNDTFNLDLISRVRSAGKALEKITECEVIRLVRLINAPYVP